MLGAQAATQYWDSNVTAGHASVSGTWSTSSAQWGDLAGTAALTAWTNGNDAQFDTGGTNAVTISGTVIANAINFSANGTNANIGSGTLQLGAGGITGANSATITIANTTALQLSASQAWSLNGGTATFNSAITETGAGGYTLTLNAPNANKTANFGGTINIAAINHSSGNLTSTFSGNVTLANALTNTAGTMTLSGTNSFGGGLILTGGTTIVSADANLGAGGAINFNGGTLQVTGTILNNFSASSHAVTFTATKTTALNIAAAGNTFTVDKVLNQTTGGLTKTGLGSLTLNQNNTYTGATTVTDGTLNLDYATNNGTKIGNSGGTGALTLNGATLTSTGTQAATEVINGLVIGAGTSNLGANPVRSTITGNSANTFDFSSGTFTRTAGGVIAFPTSGGPTVKLPGTAGAIVGAGWATIGDNYISVDASQIVTAFTAYNNDTFTAGQNSNIATTGGAWAGTSINTLRVDAAGATTTTLTGANTLATGGILVSSAVGSNQTTLTGAGTITTSNNDLVATLNNSGTLQIDNTLTLGTGRLVLSGTGGGTLKLTAGNTFTGTTNLYNGTLEMAPGSGVTATLTGAVVGAGGIVKSGLGTLLLASGANTYAGPTQIKNGIFYFNK